LRDVCSAKGIVYIMDEVMTGFRVASGGAQELFGVRPDLTTLGKIIGGGLPVGAYGGRKEIMKMVAPSGPVYQAGTLSGNPLAMAAGSTMLKLLQRRGKSVYRQLESTGAKIEKGFADITARYGLPLQINRVGSMFTLFFTSTPVTDAESARRSDTKAFSRYFSALIENGIFIPPSQFEAAFISTAHTAKDIDATLHAAEDALKITFGYDGQD
jgi:glutamate-1-semialdehyde 2,1-aminomutase